MPAKSQKQQKFFGLIRGIQKGTVKPSSVSEKAKEVAKSIPKKAAAEFASTKTKGLPATVKKKSIKEEDSSEVEVGNTYEYTMAPGDTLTIDSINGDDMKVTTLQKGKKYNGEETKSWIEQALRQGLLKLKEGKKSIKESYDNAVGNVHAVVKAFPGCTLDMLVKEIDPVMGAKHYGVDHETIHGVYPTHEKAMKIAEKVHKEHLGTMKKLDEKKGTVAGKLTKKIEQLEKEKAAHFKSKDYDKHDEVASQIKNFMDKLKKIEKSKKEKED